MDNNDEMTMELSMQYEAADDQEHRMMVLTIMLCYRKLLTAVPCQGGSTVGKAKNKNHKRLAGPLFLDSDLQKMHQIPLRNSSIVF
jgi:hypothetical protein